jgi:hypothetical protein
MDMSVIIMKCFHNMQWRSRRIDVLSQLQDVVFFAYVLSLTISWRYFVFLEVNLMSISWKYYIKMSFNFIVLYNHSMMNELLAFVDLVASCSFKLIICCLKAWWLWGSNEIWLWINPSLWCCVLKVVWCCKCEYFMVSCSFTPN